MLRRISKFDQVAPLHERGLIVLDLDDTVMTDNQTQIWWRSYLKYCLDIYGDPAVARELTLHRWQKMISDGTLRFEPTDLDGLRRLLQAAKQLGAVVVGVTARSYKLKQATRSQLETLGINFDTVDNLPHVRGGVQHSGIFYLDGNHKGNAVLDIVKHLQLEHVIFIDDTLKNHEAVQYTLRHAGVKHDCYLAEFSKR